MRLQRDQIIQTAIRLLDKAGLDALTMRRLGEELSVQAATLYWHVKNKQELLDAMAEEMLAGCVASPPVGAGWEEQVLELAERLRAALLAHRDGARVFAGTFVVEQNMLRFSEMVVGTLMRGGFPPRSGAWGSWTLVYYVIGFTLEEQALSALPEAGRGKGDVAQLRAALEGPGFPHLREAFPYLVDADLDARFRYGLQRIVRGLAAELDGEPRGKASPVPPRARAARSPSKRRG